MELTQKQTLSQRLAMTLSMRQSLRCLQMSAQELERFVQEEALSNPMLEVQAGSFYDSMPLFELVASDIAGEPETWHSDLAVPERHPEQLHAAQHSLRDELLEQLGQMALLDARMRPLCEFLVESLDSRGYLDCPLSDLAQELGCSLSELEQALYTVQLLEPCGVGARDLSECLILQLAQSSNFNALTLAIARDGLPLLAKRDYTALARLLGCTVRRAREEAEHILVLNPIPSSGYAGGRETHYIAPDAFFSLENGALTVTLNTRILPTLSVQSEYLALGEASDSKETKRYIHDRLVEANSLIRSVELRSTTLIRILRFIADTQNAFFSGGDLLPVTMQQTAEALGLSVSTVSRAAADKYLQFGTKLYPLRDFFCTASCEMNGNALSTQAVRHRIQSLIRAEDAAHPLTDEALRILLEQSGIVLSRRTVTSHRAALGIDSAPSRKRKF